MVENHLTSHSLTTWIGNGQELVGKCRKQVGDTDASECSFVKEANVVLETY